MYDQKLEELIDAALEDGVLTEKEKQVLFKKAQAMGVDLDEFEMVLDARLVKAQKAEKEKAAQAQSAAPKSNKLGDVKKCPACGAMVQSFQGTCPECGYAFEGIDANSAVKELSSLLQKTSDNKQMEKIIDNYPIPMEKAALMAFITWLRPQSTDSKNPLANSYLKKYSECINKIRVSFANDKELQPLLSYYESDVKKVRNQKIIRFTLKNKWFWVGAAVIFILILILIPAPLNKNSDKTNKAMLEAIDAGDLKKAEELCRDFKKAPYYIATGRTALCRAFIQKGDLEKAEEYVENIELEDEISNAYLKQGNLEKAKKFAKNKEVAKAYFQQGDYDEYMEFANNETTGEFIRDVIVDLCKKGKKNEAKRFLNAYSDKISDQYDNLGLGSYPTKDGGSTILGDRAYVTKKLRKMIDEY